MSQLYKLYCSWDGALVIVLLLLALPQFALSQTNTFIESYDIPPITGDYTDQVITDGEDIYITLVTSFTDTTTQGIDSAFFYSRSGIAKLSNDGELLWYNVFDYHHNGVGTTFSNGLVTTEDTIYGNGHYKDSITKVFTPVITASHKQTGAFRIRPSNYGFTVIARDIFQGANKGLVTVNENRSEDTPWPAIIEKRDSNGVIFSSEEYLTDMTKSSLTQSSIDGAGNLYVSQLGCRGGNDCYRFEAWLTKITADGEVAWQRSYGHTEWWEQPVIPWISVVNDTTLAYSWTRDTSGSNTQVSPPVVYYLDTLGNKRDSFTFRGTFRNAIQLAPTADGGVVGTGFATNGSNYSGWLFRLDANADLVWERYVIDHRQSTFSETDLECITVMDDGSIVAGGDIFHPLPPRDGGARLRGWVVKLDADGCLEPGCTSDTIYLEFTNAVGEPEMEQEVDLKVWPNPAVNKLNWSLPDLPVYRRITDYRIINTSGYVMRRGTVAPGSRSVDVRDLPPGVYFLNLLVDGKIRGVKKFVKR